MSSRQMRRLQDLVSRATGLDAAEEEEEADEWAVPSTTQPTKPAHRHHDKKKAKKEKAEEKAEGKEAPAAKSSSDPVSSTSGQTKKSKKSEKYPSQEPAAAGAAASSSSPTADDWEEVGEDDEVNINAAPATKDSTTHKKKNARADEEAEEEKNRKKEERRKLRQQQRRQKQAEEDALLDAVLANQADSHNAAKAVEGELNCNYSSSAPGSPNTTNAAPPHTHSHAEANATGDATSSLQYFVMACDAQQLDTRLERIRMFGADAVEDVGDGRTPHRRADGRVRDTGSVSFFPAHHMHVNFMRSAFATPNRLRWIPYDSLGVYLTTEEGRGTQRRTRREYTLNCDSNAFQRALAQLGACQDRMGGVQDLVECLARNKVYHIPTLLQCVYAMEATGESAFAGELLDVALYQVGVILRRVALSGTWAQRRLPVTRGGNALIFQVLQRGVHAALKRGCLRTAFERTRCVLSLDERDPCGMLLLLDYTALRAKRWMWLLEMRHRVRTSAGNTQDISLERSIKALPNYAFSWALAKHFIEREERRQGGGDGGGGNGRPSKVLRGITDAQREVLASTPAAVELLTFALTRFPHAAVCLVKALGGVEVVCGGASGGGTSTSDDDVLPVADCSVWFDGVLTRAAEEISDEALQQRRLAELFVARHEELWKLTECISLLRAAVRSLVYESKTASGTDIPASPLTRNSPLLDPYAYLDLTQEAVLGVSVAPIPADLLRPDAADLGMGGGDGEGDGGDMLRVDPAMAQELLRMVRQNIEDGVEDEATQRYLQQLEEELGERLRRGRPVGEEAGGLDALRGNRQHHHPNNNIMAGDAAGELDWYDYDDEEAEDVEAQEWYSVASGEDRDNDDDADVERQRRGGTQ
ncbi:hypothetical protein ABB37_08480 [Leptomonas pyrrhocoris]|uniref:Uncharacterized protein n=1 Tax=Leptomonas pyrrhocoris TaxID=157538 RepID=A0A0N0VDL7_LEPPY|nr:hypothetical protein ABB37_08480 [Leptomonas pyrrhocoris]KPA75608.1 hypothetical protein ABB37_08480 [Leptomonas pyrrhocoris]|eukprot:XP_015654047.1 hypothetical protein ABB37_08480 [Leptomonas pyrrhocoris]